jgi:predicted Zn-dependent peptidase
MSKEIGRFGFNDVYSRFTASKFSSGLSVHHLFIPNADFLHVGFILHCGSRQNFKPGLAHFVEHLASKNGFLDKTDKVSFFRACGGSFNFGTTYPDSTVYGFSVPVRRETILKGLRLFFSMLFESKFNELEQERVIVINEAERKHGDRAGMELRLREAKKILYWHDFYKNVFTALGRKKDILSITREDVRSFRGQYYIPANTSIVMVGGMKETAAVSVLKEAGFSWEKNGDEVSLPTALNPKLPLEKVYRSPTIQHNDQSVDCRCLAALPISSCVVPIFFCRAIDLVFESRIREGVLGLYNSSSDWSNFVDFFQVRFDLDAVPSNRMKEALQEIDFCLDEVASDKSLFAKVKKWSLAAYAINDEDGASIMTNAANSLRVRRRIRTLAEGYEQLVELSFDEVSAFANNVRARLWKGFFRT